jgi:hypothetical protein
LTKDCNKTSCKKGDPPPKPREMQDEEEFFDLVGKEHVDPRLKTAETVRSIVERIRARTRAS